MNNSTCIFNVGMRKLLEAINHAPAGIAFITDENERLCGVVTDGDFRRMLLAGKSLDESLSKEDLNDYVYAMQGEKMEDLLSKTDRKVRIIPIVNDHHKMVDYFRYEHRVHMMPVAEPDLQGNEYKYLSDAFLSTWISSRGKYIDEFENNFAAFCEAKHGVAVSNGTVALHLAMKAMDIGEGDEVIVPDLTFAASINTVLHAHATPVIVDIKKDSWCIDPEAIEAAITSRTKAIMPVHVYGQPCDMDAIMAIAKQHNLYVIEDAAEAHGATYKGQKVGSIGDVACFSFYGNKVITTGEGGMCTTNSDALNERMRVLRDHGMSKQQRYWHDEVGFNYRMTNLQAAIGVAQLERIEEILKQRKNVEAQYKAVLNDVTGIEWQQDFPDRERTVWLVCATLNGINRDALFDQMRSHGVDTRPFFFPLSTMDIYKDYVHSSGNSHEVAKVGLNLPTIKNIDYDKVLQAFNSL